MYKDDEVPFSSIRQASKSRRMELKMMLPEQRRRVAILEDRLSNAQSDSEKFLLSSQLLREKNKLKELEAALGAARQRSMVKDYKSETQRQIDRNDSLNPIFVTSGRPLQGGKPK